MNIQRIIELATFANANYARVYAEKRFPPSVYYYFLQKLAEAMKPSLSVELGVCGGGGSYHLAKGYPGKVIGVDITNDYPDNIEYIIRNYPNYTFKHADSIQAAHDIPDAAVDILFIDTVHTLEQTYAELEAWMPKMAANSVICMDDLFRDGMQVVWAYIPREKVRLDFLHVGGSPTDGGFGVVLI